MPRNNRNIVHQFFVDLIYPRDVYGTLRPLLFICFLSGIAPLKMVGGPGNRRMVTTCLGVVYTLLILVAFFASYFIWVVKKRSVLSYLYNYRVQYFGENIQILTSFMAIGFALIMCFLKRNKLRKLLQTLARADEILTELGATINYKYTSRIMWVYLIIQWTFEDLFIWYTNSLLQSLKEPLDYYAWTFFFVPFAVISTLRVKYVCIMRLIAHRFSYINLTLTNLRMDGDEEKMNKTPFRGKKINRLGEIECDAVKSIAATKRDKCNTIALLCRAHEEICDACILIQDYFSHQLLMMVFISYLVALFNVFFVLSAFFRLTPLPSIDGMDGFSSGTENFRSDETGLISRRDFFLFYLFYNALTVGTLAGILQSAESVTTEVSSTELFEKKIAINPIESNQLIRYLQFRTKNARLMRTNC